MRPAEMQTLDVTYPIGYFAGTSERGDYEKIQKSISNNTGENTGISFQFVDQNGVSPKMWRYAKEQADTAFENPYSKEHKRVKDHHQPPQLPHLFLLLVWCNCVNMPLYLSLSHLITLLMHL